MNATIIVLIFAAAALALQEPASNPSATAPTFLTTEALVAQAMNRYDAAVKEMQHYVHTTDYENITYDKAGDIVRHVVWHTEMLAVNGHTYLRSEARNGIALSKEQLATINANQSTDEL